MDSINPLVVPLHKASGYEAIVGGKAAKLSQLMKAGFRVPDGFCLTTVAYEQFLNDSNIEQAIQMELGRKSFEEMRWEEIWDAALRIRSLFLRHELSEELQHAIRGALAELRATQHVAVRSSALGEDSAVRSFAGLHESFTGVTLDDQVGDSVRLVWASLWSDAALLYRKELQLDPTSSRMAVLVQEMIDEDRSGVAFGRDPRDPTLERAIVEAVPGPCSLLVDGAVDPDRWELRRDTGQVLAWLPGQREKGETEQQTPLLESTDLVNVLDAILSVENLFDWPPDMEWTGRSAALTILQARPITKSAPDPEDKRNWYLSLCPGDSRLRDLCQRVSQQLIPKLEADGERLAAEELDSLDDDQLAKAIDERRELLQSWKQIYWDDFIPFAHGVRRLATYYNDALRPDDPYEFVGLLRNRPLLAEQRNNALRALATQLADNEPLRDSLDLALNAGDGSPQWQPAGKQLLGVPGADAFLREFEEVTERFLDIAFDEGRLQESPEPLLRNILELARQATSSVSEEAVKRRSAELEQRLLDAVGPDRVLKARELIEIGRISWKLRDDDNLLVARIESQLLRSLEVATKRLRAVGRVTGEGQPTTGDAEELTRVIRDAAAGSVALAPHPITEIRAKELQPNEQPRQLLGQPASPGVATAPARIIRGRDDLGSFRHGEILVCDAIEPTMTHLVPLAAAIVERRGGMLIHGAIIAREFAIPCVNGVRKAADVLKNGDVLTVDGHLGIVTVGVAEFDLEFQIVGPDLDNSTRQTPPT